MQTGPYKPGSWDVKVFTVEPSIQKNKIGQIKLSGSLLRISQNTFVEKRRLIECGLC